MVSLPLLIDRFERLSRFHRLGIWLVQLSIFAGAGLAAFLLRFDGDVPAAHQAHLLWALAVWLAVKAVVFRLLALDRGWWGFVSIDDVLRIGCGNVAASAGSFALIRLLAPGGFPRSIYLIDLGVCFLMTAGARVCVRILRESCRHNGRHKGARRTLIYGAGEAGFSLLREIRANPKLPYAVCGFIDDNGAKRGLVVQGVRVLGRGDKLAGITAAHKVDMVLIALPSATGAEMTRILQRCHGAGVSFKTVPGMGELIESNGLAKQIRDVAVEDLLGRTPVRLEEEQIREKLEGKVVLVTGAGGSIGSELCRQIARFGPRAIVGFEVAETALFQLDLEMRKSFPEAPFHAVIGNIQNAARVAEVFRQYAPAVVYHAAAYKHVPMMESHVFEAIENNVFGTYNVAAAAAEHGAEDFVLISSDKAVRPANVMGATKRLAELVVQSLQDGISVTGYAVHAQKTLGTAKPVTEKTLGTAKPVTEIRTRYVAVRFGNVLGSAGSVIPTFKQQIAAGGPVTVTHPEMRRYFMTIPEACQLVLQASAMGQGGEVFVLDMGEPMKIVDLARNLVLLSGLRPEEDIRIEFTGVRPGEKLYEELSTLLEDTLPTPHEKIRVFAGYALVNGEMSQYLESLRELCESRDLGPMIVALKEMAPDYSPSAHVLRRAVVSAGARRAVAAGA